MTRVAVSESYTADAFKDESEILTRLGLDDSVDVVGAHQQILLAVDLDLVATELTVDDNVADLNVHGDALALVVDLTGANGNDGARAAASPERCWRCTDQKRSSARPRRA